MQNSEKIPSIKEVVEQLRTEGRLDEGKWNTFRFKMLYVNWLVGIALLFCISYLFITNDEIGIYLSSAIICILSFVIIKIGVIDHNKMMAKQLYCYNLGKKVSGTVLSIHKSDTGTLFFQNRIFISYAFNDSIGNSVNGKIGIHRIHCSVFQTISTGDGIDVFFIDKNPCLNAAFVLPHAERFIIKRR